ncbi:MAG TPA: proton-conducting transporter membrane subunit [Gemmatimonadales bacterium]|nr:proton-conducting transporter membrane subunit [Gemmatimonadales bacterium]
MILLLALLGVPAVAAAVAFAHRSPGARAAWLGLAASAHAALSLGAWIAPPPPILGGWLALDALGRVALTTVSAVFLVVAWYAVGYLRRVHPRGGRAFASCLLGFLAAATLVTLSHHFALLWVGLEGTTLAVAPLIFHRHDRRSLEAVWKYLVISSVGIALALLGVFFLASAQAGDLGARPLVLEDLVSGARALQPAWLKAAFIFLLVGFGTKMGLAPMHTWKPDTYGEAPSLVGGLMAGALTTCAFLGLVRITQVAVAGGIAPFIQPLLIVFGLLSIVVAAAFLVGQTDLRRLLAYSSVEHMGLLSLGLGLGGVGAYGAMLHMVNNALVKGLMFLAVGNVLLAAGDGAAPTTGALRRTPASGVLLLVGLFAVTGSPPFGPFLSQFAIVTAAFQGGHYAVALALLVLLAVIFVSLGARILDAVYAPGPAAPVRESRWLVAGPAVLGLAVLGLGVFIPPPLFEALAEGARALGGWAP